MGLIKKYRFYKRLLQFFVFCNVTLIIFGAVAGYEFLKSSDTTALQVSLIGAGAFFFGILIPGLVIWKLEQTISEVRKQTEKNIAKLVAIWVESRSNSPTPYKNPQFWASIGLVAIESFAENFDHPTWKIVAELAPIFREEISRQSANSQETASGHQAA